MNIFKYKEELIGTKLGEKSTMDFVNYLTDFEGDVQTGLEKGMVN